ncbi:uncharacterized protein LOC111398071 [Olea europaea subsp. europaea]|uniref:Uncharacterized protein LOC111398071 n=1 Tax=Olea europaea subsp. europaea TaxID=158383 RepID=A0A8S0RUH6_OLEEU|nr:uncharacterized protein LOC111398071 [Olea europaea subsp. europaea]
MRSEVLICICGYARNVAFLVIDHTDASELHIASKMNTSLYNILKSVVPSKSYLVAKGEAFHEYLPTLSQISRLEDCRLPECIDKRKQRRARVARHYLRSGSLAFSAEQISLIGEHNSYLKSSSHRFK